LNYLMEPTHLDGMMRYAERLAASSLLPACYQKQPANLLLVLGMAQELGIPPMQAINGINVIQGKPTVSPQLMLALIRQKMPMAFIEVTNEPGKVTVIMARDKSDMSQKTISIWDMSKATAMGLAGKDNWKKQAQNMLKWRAVAEAARECFPDVIMGLYTTEELAPDSIANDEGDIVEIKREIAKIDQNRPIDKLRDLVKKKGLEGKSRETIASALSAIFPIESLADIALVEEKYLLEMIEVLNAG